MTSKYYQYAVYSSGMMLAGHFTFTRMVDKEHATNAAAHEAQIIAADADIPFDYANFSIAVRAVSKHAPVDSNTYWEVDPAL
jgi:hypothetical protein